MKGRAPAQRHKAALEAARQSEQLRPAAAGSNDGLWDGNHDRRALLGSLEADDRPRPGDERRHVRQWLTTSIEDQPSFRTALDSHLKGESAHFEHSTRAPRRRRDPLGAVPRHRRATTTASRSAWPVADRHHRPRRVQNSLERAAKETYSPACPTAGCSAICCSRRWRGTPRAARGMPCSSSTRRLRSSTTRPPDGRSLLITIARRLQSHLRPGDVLARVGGDEFAVLIGNNATPQDVRAS